MSIKPIMAFLAALLFLTMPMLADNRMPATFRADSFRIEISQIRPFTYPSRNLTAGFTLEVRNDSIFLDLPYQGEVYIHKINYEILTFAAPIEQLKISEAIIGSKKRKGVRTSMILKCRRDNFLYHISITAYPRGEALIDISTTAAQPISFIGEWE